MSNEVLPKPVKIAIAVLVSVLAIFTATTWAAETNYAGYTTIRQMPISGTMGVFTEPGLFWQWGGQTTTYKQASTITFGETGEEGASLLPPVAIQFNDSGTATCYGNARFELPRNQEQMLEIHRQYRSYDHLVETLLSKQTSAAMNLTASMFSAEDTYAGGKAEFTRLTLDQLQHGVYQTDVKEEESEDPITKEKRRIRKVNIRKDSNGLPLRLDNPLSQFGIKCTQFIISRNFEYETGIQQQIAAQRNAFMQTVTARAEAQKATQEVITAKAKGEAEVTTAEYQRLIDQKRQEVDAETAKKISEIEANKLKAVAQIDKERSEIQAQQRLVVAQLEKQAAEQTKQQQILLGEGEAARKRAVMEADGALEVKLKALTEINANYANAIKDYRGSWVPQVSMGAQSSNNGMNNVTDLINMLMIKTAKELAIDTSVKTPVKQEQ